MARTFLWELRHRPKETLLSLVLAPLFYLLFCLYLFLRSVFGGGSRGRNRRNFSVEKYHREQDERERHGDPVPLCQMRARSLTVIQERLESSHIVPLQVLSPLFSKLSTELRVEIYRLALGGGGVVLHLARAHQRLTHIRCFADSKDYDKHPWRHACWGYDYRDGAFQAHAPHHDPNDRDLLALLRTCHRMYVKRAILPSGVS